MGNLCGTKSVFAARPTHGVEMGASTVDLSSLVVGVAGTGMMAGAHAFRHAQAGFPVVIGSREPQRAQQLAQQIVARGADPARVTGATQAEMVEQANFIILAIPPRALRDFIDAHRARILGKSKMFVDLSVTFSRFGSPEVQPPAAADGPHWHGPYFDMPNYLHDRLGDPTASFCKAWHNLYFKSIANDKVQPVECGGGDPAKSTAMAVLQHEGWEPLDCGGMAELPRIETGFHPRRVRHPRHLEFNGPNHP